MTREELKKHVNYIEFDHEILDELRVGISAEIRFTMIKHYVDDYGNSIEPTDSVMEPGVDRTIREMFQDEMLDEMILRMKEDLKDL